MAIYYQSEDIAFPSAIKRREVSKWIRVVVDFHRKKVGEIGIIFCSDEKILKVNKQYLQHDYYTDIITFDYTEENQVAGDLFISLDTVKSNSEKFNTDFIEELHRVIIHGILHLCGFKDKSPTEEKEMREKEEEALKQLPIINK